MLMAEPRIHTVEWQRPDELLPEKRSIRVLESNGYSVRVETIRGSNKQGTWIPLEQFRRVNGRRVRVKF